ncbi:MAG: cobalamin-dependent protein [Candidatus Bathyarchaeota archaeon]|nr:cobalamin-dependent protein [Candidatus Bathyarchaeota archaeon]
MSDTLEDVASRFSDLDLDGTLDLTRKALEKGFSAHKILEEGLSRGLDRVGELFERKEYFLSELMVATYIMEHAMKVIEDKLKSEAGGGGRRGRVVFGTVAGDFHFIGKNIAISLLQASGYEVHDLGEDVPPEAFVKKVREVKPDIVALSALLLTTVSGIGEVMEALERESLRDQVFVMIGGRPTSQEVAEKYGVDAYCATAMDGVATANKYMEKKRGRV